MKYLLSLSLLAILLGGCSTEETTTDSSLGDMYEDGSEEVDFDEYDGDLEDGEVAEEEIPDSVGPTDIPADLIPSR